MPTDENDGFFRKAEPDSCSPPPLFQFRVAEVDAVSGGAHSEAEGGSLIRVPLFYLEGTNNPPSPIPLPPSLTPPPPCPAGIVLFPHATLPLRVMQPRFLAAVRRAMTSPHLALMIGVVTKYTPLPHPPLFTPLSDLFSAFLPFCRGWQINVGSLRGGRGIRVASVGTTAEVRHSGDERTEG